LIVLALTMLVLVAAARGLAQTGPAPFRGNMEELTEQNTDFRHVIFTGAHVQVVAMSLAPNEDIGAEVHPVDQCFFFVEGAGETVAADKVSAAKEDAVLCVPAGIRHNVRNTGGKPLKLYTIYSPPQHPAGTVHRTKQDAKRAERKTEAKPPR
jgi:mannose-6-phosphate isomerase-like protein (cupin superfamily)